MRDETIPQSRSTRGIGLGINAGLDKILARDLAAHCQELGYHSLWSNDEPGASGLETLAAFATGAPRLELGVGVLPLDRHPPAQIAAEIDRLGLDATNLLVEVGSGQTKSPGDVVRRSVLELRELLPDEARIVVAAMRPERAAVLRGLAPYKEVLDLTIVRVLADKNADSLNAVVEAAAL